MGKINDKIVGNISYFSYISIKLKTQIMNELTKLEEAAASKSKLNDNLNYQPLKLIFEIITNIPKIASNIFWNFKKETNGIRIIFRQNVGTTIQTIQNGLATNSKIEDETHFDGKNGNHGGLFGTGLSLVNQYVTELFIRTSGQQWDGKTDAVTSYDIDNDTIEIELLIPIGSYKQKYIKDAKDLIEKTDFFISSNERKHNFIVEGFTPTENIELSKPLQKEILVWKTPTGTDKDSCDFDKVKDEHGNPISESIIPITISRGKKGEQEHIVKLKDFQIGKLKQVPKCWNVDDINKPFLVLVSEEANQVVGIVSWTGSHPVSVNNSCIIARVSKVDLRWLFGTADKMEGFHYVADTEFVKWTKGVLNKYYPDSNVVESGGQFFSKDVIVYDKIGKTPSNNFRKDIGLEWMNSLTTQQREKLVYLEWSAGKDRFDFYIWLAEDGKVTPTTKKILAESKRKGFGDGEFNQLFRYMGSESKVVGGIGLSIGISPTHITNFNKITTKIQGSGQLAVRPTFHLLDLLDYGFENYLEEYTEIAMVKTKEGKEKAKLEALKTQNN